MYESIPQELKELKQWVCWKGIPDESRQGKLKKIPINPYTMGQAQSNNSETWADFKTALKSSKKVSGIGFMFANGYFGVDIDDISEDIEKYKEGETDNIVSEFIDGLQTYSEYSVSQKGIHLICKGKLPPQGRRRGNVEMYESGRYFIMTGNIAAKYSNIKDCTEAIKVLHEKYIGGGQTPSIIVNTPPLTINEDTVIELAKKSKQGQIFTDLYNGNWQCYFKSQSEADLSFCNTLAFWCQRDERLMDKIYRSSGLMRAKWNRRQSGSTYGQITLSKAIRECERVYEPPKSYKINIKEAQKEEEKKKRYLFDDTGNAERFTDMFGEVIRYSYINKKWLYYDGRRWCFDYTGAIKRMADEIVNTMADDLPIYTLNVEDEEEAKKLFMKHVKASRSSKSKTAMIKESEHKVSILPNQMDICKTIFNTPNGIINLKSGKLFPHDCKKYITKIGYTEYTENIDCPEWLKFLDSIFNNDKELIKYIQKAVGYSLTGSTQEQCIFILYGTGRNGKTTFIDVITDMFGDYAINIQPETIMVKNYNGAANSDIARLKGARIVTSVEPNEGMRLNEGLIKQLTGGDKVTARKLFEDEFEFKPEFKLWLATNHKPIIRGTDTGIWRRMHLIPFTIEIPEDKVDKSLKSKLKNELKGILKWAVEGCLLWQKEGLEMPQIIKQATKEYRNEMDVISAFLEECTEVNSSSKVGASELYEVYKKWASDNNEYEMSSRKFGIEMTKRFEKVKIGGFFYKSIKIKQEYKQYSISIKNN